MSGSDMRGYTAIYAVGAGLGHLTRTLKLIKVLGITSPVIIITNSHFLDVDQLAKSKISLGLSDLFDLHHVIAPPKGVNFLAWFKMFSERENIRSLIIDCFPVGINGELNGLTDHIPELKLMLVARAIRWKRYERLITQDNTFHRSVYVEDLQSEQVDYLVKHSGVVEPLALPSEIALPSAPDLQLPSAYCAVIHSGSKEEVHALVLYAERRLALQERDFPIVLISPEKHQLMDMQNKITQVCCYPALALLLKSKIVVSAAGFNTLHELKNAPVEHWVVPFERRFDDQFLRAEKYRG